MTGECQRAPLWRGFLRLGAGPAVGRAPPPSDSSPTAAPVRRLPSPDAQERMLGWPKDRDRGGGPDGTGVHCADRDAAAPKGSYKGSSKGTIEVMVPDPVLFKKFVKQTDTGKISFRVSGSAVKSFSIKGQKLMCGGQPLEADVTIASIALNSKGSGTGTKTIPGLGPMKVTIKVTAKGAALRNVEVRGQHLRLVGDVQGRSQLSLRERSLRRRCAGAALLSPGDPHSARLLVGRRGVDPVRVRRWRR